MKRNILNHNLSTCQLVNLSNVFALLSLVFVLTACGGSTGRTLTSATGTIYECLVVIPGQALSQPSLNAIAQSGAVAATGSAYAEPIATDYDLVKATMSADMPCMPQMEPYFVLTQVPPAAFDDYLKPTRNILIIDINPDKYTQTQAKVSVDVWSHPQAVYRIQTPTSEEFVAYWLAHGEQVRQWFVRRELLRQTAFYRGSTNKDARAALKAHYGCDMLVPEDYMLLMDTALQVGSGESACSVRLLWCCNNKGPMRRDLVVYTYPYTDDNTFTPDYLNQRRDEVLSQVITASVPGSYMGTEYKVFPPRYRTVSSLTPRKDEGFYAAEVRGLWKIKDGEAMGGPYVSLTRLDQVRGNVITAETFLFAPGQKKRNALRQAEAILYTLQLPQDTISVR